MIHPDQHRDDPREVEARLAGRPGAAQYHVVDLLGVELGHFFEGRLSRLDGEVVWKHF
jgi:hypothetical protein